MFFAHRKIHCVCISKYPCKLVAACFFNFLLHLTCQKRPSLACTHRGTQSHIFTIFQEDTSTCYQKEFTKHEVRMLANVIEMISMRLEKIFSSHDLNLNNQNAYIHLRAYTFLLKLFLNK